jgi:DNA-binding FadR family transcriptional regulator
VSRSDDPSVAAKGPTTLLRTGTGQRPKLATKLREQILADISAGRWRPGDRLPTEVELMLRFGVSRAPVREAMQSLHLLGIVDISPRRGATVRALPVQSVVDLAVLSGSMSGNDTIGDVFEFRDVMESAIAELSARNARPEQLADLREIIADNRRAVEKDDRAEAQAIDVRFHGAIAEASGNLVFTAVAAALGGLLVELRRATGGIPGASREAFTEHLEIFEAVERGDGPAARRATERHIRNTRARFEAAHRDDGSSAGATDRRPRAASDGSRAGGTARSVSAAGLNAAGGGGAGRPRRS